jgi:hypothetical protein
MCTAKESGRINGHTLLPTIVSGFEPLPGGKSDWKAKVIDPERACLLIKDLSIDAGKDKLLYLKMSVGSTRSVQVAFAGDNKYSLIRSFRCILSDNIPVGAGPVVLQFDLDEFPLWKGIVRNLWLNFEKTVPGEIIQLYGVSSASQPVELETIDRVVAVALQLEVWAMTDRMAAYHQTLVDVDETKPNVEILTYNLDEFVFLGQYLLTRLITYVDVHGKMLGPDDSLDLHVEDFPGGVSATYRMDAVSVSMEVVPLLVGRESNEQHGVALYRIKTTPAAPVTIHCGGGGKVLQWGPEHHTHIREDKVGDRENTIEITGDIAVLRSMHQPLPVVVRSAGRLSKKWDEDGGCFLEVRFAQGSGELLIGFAREASQAVELVSGINIESTRQAVDEYYADLLESRIETPEPELDGAFRSAIYNLEYNWYQPYGWIECMHHWVGMWHMQHTLGAEWLGQADRSRSTTLSQAERLYPNGAVPMLGTNAQPFMAWGGTNQFFAWQVRHYWQFTAERAFIEKMAPLLDRVIDQTYQQYDPDGDQLLAWKEQIGNQEDYSHHPHNGSATSIEGINMLRTRAILARALGDEVNVEACEARITAAKANLHQKLWQADLGRFAYFEDPHGVKRPDGLYQEYIYPAIYDILDPLDSWTSIRHLRDRLTGAGGEIYCSNTFPNHVGGTWGMQAGMSQQPWGAWGLAAVGLRNECFQPLRAVARWVMSERLRGGWPEISVERYVSYYSPPPAVYIQAVVEALFGLEVNKPEGTLKVAPSFPDAWQHARLNLPEYQAKYRREGNTLFYEVASKDNLVRQVRWLLPPGKICEVMVGGKPFDYQLSARVGCQLLEFTTPSCHKCTLQVTVEPLQYQVTCPASIAEGDELQVSLQGCRMLKLDDRGGVLSQVEFVNDTCLKAVIQAGLLQLYLKYGRLGQLNFSRRTFFLYCQGDDGSLFWHPVDITVLPRYEISQQDEVVPTGKEGKTNLTVRNNTFTPLKGNAALHTAGGIASFEIDLLPRAEGVISLTLSSDCLSRLSSGDNIAWVILPGGEKLDLILSVSGSLFDLSLQGELCRSSLLELPAEELVSDEKWKSFRTFYAYDHLPWARNGAPLAGLDLPFVNVPGLPVAFKLNNRRLVPVSWRYGQPAFRLDLGGKRIKKLYLLLVPFLDNHDTFTPVAQVTLQRADDRLIGRTLYSPGDLDWWCSEKAVDIFCTARLPRPDRHGLLPLLGENDSDWSQGKPSVSYFTPNGVWVNEHDEPWETSFPQPEYWASCRVLKTDSAVLNVVEIDLVEPAELESLTLETIGTEPAIGLVAVMVDVG